MFFASWPYYVIKISEEIKDTIDKKYNSPEANTIETKIENKGVKNSESL